MHLLRSSRIVSAGKTSLPPNAKISDLLTVTSKIPIGNKKSTRSRNQNNASVDHKLTGEWWQSQSERLKSTHFQNPFAFRRIHQIASKKYHQPSVDTADTVDTVDTVDNVATIDTVVIINTISKPSSEVPMALWNYGSMV